MNKDKVKNELKLLFGKRVNIKINVGRKKINEYEGVVNGIYSNLFTVKICEEIKSFSYVDILTKNLVIKELK